MNLGKAKIVPLLLVVIAAISIPAIILRPKPPIGAVFSDGTKVTVEKASVGFRHEFHIGSKLYADFIQHWPKYLPKLPAAKYRSEPFTSTRDELVTWISQRNATNKDAMMSHLTTFIEDEHGCVFAGPGGGAGVDFGDGKMKLDAVEHPVFPRRQKQIKLVVQKWPGMGPNAVPPVTLTMPNPKVLSPVEWKPEPFPIAKKSDDLKVTLQKIETTFKPAPRMLWANNDLKSRQGEWRFAPQFEMEQNGQPTRDWTCPSMIYSDVTGNTHTCLFSLSSRARP